MYCTKCGWKNADEATHCSNCSADLREQIPTESSRESQQQEQPSEHQQYPQQTGPQPEQPVYQPQTSPSNTLSIIGIVLGILAIPLCPFLFGGAGIILGVMGKSKNERLGVTAIIVSVCGMVVGIIIRAILAYRFASMHHGF